MRPEYIAAVDAVRRGYMLWLPLVPAVFIWYAAIQWRRGFVMFVLAWACCWFLLVNHSNAIQAAKHRHMQTDEEIKDWASDTWNTFAPISAVPYSLVYCLANAVLAYSLIGTGRFACELVSRRKKNATDSDGETDFSPYRESLVREFNDEDQAT